MVLEVLRKKTVSLGKVVQSLAVAELIMSSVQTIYLTLAVVELIKYCQFQQSIRV